MTLRHPFEWLSDSGRKHAFLAVLASTLVLMVTLRALDSSLKTEAAPAGIVSFEFAGKPSVAQSIIKSWGETERVSAGVSLGLDYLFLAAYATTIGLGCVLVACSRLQSIRPLSFAGVVLAWAQLGAALLDCVENYALIRVLLGSQQGSWPAIARWCAAPKFLIVAVGLLYICVGAIVVTVARIRRRI